MCSVKTVVIWSCPSQTSSCMTRCWSATPATTCSWSPALARSATSSSRRPSPQPPAERSVLSHGPPWLCPGRFGLMSWAPRCHPNLLWCLAAGRVKDEEELLLFGRLGLEAEMHCEAVWVTEKRKGRVCEVGDWDGGVAAGEVFLQNTLLFKDIFSLERCSVPLPPHGSPLAVPCPRHISNLSAPAESPTFSTKHLHPPYRHCLALQRTIAHPSTCRGLQSLYLYYWRLSTLKEKNCCYSI